MQLPEVERLCRAVVPGAGSIDLKYLGAGLLSETYRVARDDVAYTLKVAVEHRPDLRADLPWEVRVLEGAASAGLAPRWVYCDLDGAVLLTRWAEGRSWVSQEAAAPANLETIAALLRHVHALAVPLPAREVTPLQWIKIYAEALLRRNLTSSDPTLHSAAVARTESLAELPPVAGVVCHSDLHAMNLIREDDSLILLDWEYAHVTDPLWDLAGWCANNDFEADIQRTLLARYLEEAPNLTQWRRFRLLLALYDYVCLLWSQLYLSVRGAGANGVAERLRLLDARLRVAAHYAA
jgi:aminoglycoside phosphotransferase (APT) family kinase protein